MMMKGALIFLSIIGVVIVAGMFKAGRATAKKDQVDYASSFWLDGNRVQPDQPNLGYGPGERKSSSDFGDLLNWFG